MSEPSVQLDEIVKRFGKVREMSIAEKQKMFYQIGRKVKYSLLPSQMTGIKNPEHVVSMQKIYLGSGLGYAAVRAADTSTGANSPGAITNYLENGHRRVVPVHKKGGDYGTRELADKVKGFYFYKKTKSVLLPDVKREVEDFANSIADKLRGE